MCDGSRLYNFMRYVIDHGSNYIELEMFGGVNHFQWSS